MGDLRHSFSVLGSILLAALVIAGCDSVKEKAPTKVPIDVTFDPEIVRLGETGDNWCQTWAADGDIYTAMCDGVGWTPGNFFSPHARNNALYRIRGGPDTATFQASLLDGAPDYSRLTLPPGYDDWKQKGGEERWRHLWRWFAYGIVSVEGNVYLFLSHPKEPKGFGWFDGCTLIWRPRGQRSWKRWNGTDAGDADRWFAGRGGNQLLFHNEPDYAFSFITIAQYGQDYRENTDGYIYLYAPNGPHKPYELNMARVRKDRITDRAQWEYFVRRNDDGTAEWARDNIEARGVVHRFPDNWGWYSWSPSVVWNKDLGLFLMSAAGTQRKGTGDPLEQYMHYEAASLSLLWAEQPWGPWHQFHWNERWDNGDDKNRFYEPQFSPKWIFDNGRTMYLILSDAGEQYSTDHYKWNMQKLTLRLGEPNSQTD